MTSGSDPKADSKEAADARAARLEAMLDEIHDEPGDSRPPAAADAAVVPPVAPVAVGAPVADVTPAEVSTPDLDQLDADWGDMGADESAKLGALTSPRAAAVALKADVPTSPKPVDTSDMLAGYDDDDEDDDDYSAKTVIGRVPDLVALTRKEADAPLRTNLRTPRAAPVVAAEPQRDVPTIRPEPKVVIDAEVDFSSVAPPPAIPPAAPLPRPLSDPPEAPTRMAPVILESTPPPRAGVSRSVPPPDKDPVAWAAEKAAAEARTAARKAKERSRADAMRERKKARAEAVAKKQKTKQPRRSRPPPASDSEADTGGATMDAVDDDGDTGDSLAPAPAAPRPLARSVQKMALLVLLVVVLGALLLGIVMRK